MSVQSNVLEDKPIGVIAGSGDLPKEAVREMVAEGRSVFILAFEDETDSGWVDAYPHEWIRVGSIGKAFKILESHDIQDLLLVGKIRRPTMKGLRLDFTGLRLLKRIVQSNSKGDDALFRIIIQFIEDKGLNVWGVEVCAPTLLAQKGLMGKIEPNVQMQNDISLGMEVAHIIGKADVGQSVVVHQGVVIGVEAIEGTDALIARCKDLCKEKRGGVLVKMCKPNQDGRIDLPTIGVDTINNVHNAGFGGVAVEAGGTIIVNRDKVVARANELGMVLIGV